MKKFILTAFVALSFVLSNAQEKITFKALDGVIITADVYMAGDDKPMILLCHQAGYSRGEYKEIAPELNKMGYNCIAIDQRSGDEVNGVKNETARDALSKGLGTEYLDAEKDIIAAIKYISFRYRPEKFILWGSSYSASLVLKLGAADSKIKAIVAFSPGEYFKGQINVKESIADLNKPTFVTSSKEEAPLVNAMVKGHDLVKQFIPQGAGTHGSKALWKETKGNEEYWVALKSFIEFARTWKP